MWSASARPAATPRQFFGRGAEDSGDLGADDEAASIRLKLRRAKNTVNQNVRKLHGLVLKKPEFDQISAKTV